jgi:spermidine synthase
MRQDLRLLHEEYSPISGRIQVFQEGQERKLIVEGATQSIYRSDGSLRGYWAGLVPDRQVRRALLLGLGAGTVANILRQRFPDAEVIAYELDPQILAIAKEYFHLDSQTKIRLADAREAFVSPGSFDLVITDLYRGHKFADFAESLPFLSQVRGKLDPTGLAAFNRIPGDRNDKILQEFEVNLRKIFNEVWSEKVNLNLIYWGRA